MAGREDLLVGSGEVRDKAESELEMQKEGGKQVGKSRREGYEAMA